MYTCKFCGFSSSAIEDFDIDEKTILGFWCPDCDGFTYFDDIRSETRHNFVLLLENPDSYSRGSSHKPDFPTMVSPLRYPGGKSKMIGQILCECRKQNMDTFIEPFAGGASVGLSLLLSGNIQNLYLNDLDFGIYSLFWSIKNCPDLLIDQIKAFTPSKSAYKKAQKIVLDGYEGLNMAEAGLFTLIVNRMAFSGISKANCMGNPAARWNTATLIKRIKNISQCSEHIHISNEDAIGFIEEMYWMPHATIFIDPPFFLKGKALYNQYYETEDHERLAFLLESLFQGMPGADMILTYDFCQYIENLYFLPNMKEVGRKYSIAN